MIESVRESVLCAGLVLGELIRRPGSLTHLVALVSGRDATQAFQAGIMVVFGAGGKWSAWAFAAALSV
jgi:hypothetical protein